MIPLLLKLKIPRQNKRMLNLYLPLFLIWILMVPFILILFPVFLLLIILSRQAGPGGRQILLLPALIAVICNLSGLIIQVKDKNGLFYIQFI